ncbi:MAG: hypothetical protein PHI37_05230 [Candidatus Gracilibacteria bacterium]|nr:hypothetical protein [Candidatus Gracilibacteria bacterium]
MKESYLNLIEAFYILLISGVSKKTIIKNIQDGVNKEELKIVSYLIDGIKKRYIDKKSKSVFQDINFMQEDFLALSDKIMRGTRKFFIEELIKLVAKIYDGNFHIQLNEKLVSYKDGKIIF